MKFVLVVIFCVEGICSTVYQTTAFDTRDSCEIESKTLMADIRKDFPKSYGQIFCMEEEYFKENTKNNQLGQDI